MDLRYGSPTSRPLPSSGRPPRGRQPASPTSRRAPWRRFCCGQRRRRESSPSAAARSMSCWRGATCDRSVSATPGGFPPTRFGSSSEPSNWPLMRSPSPLGRPEQRPPARPIRGSPSPGAAPPGHTPGADATGPRKDDLTNDKTKAQEGKDRHRVMRRANGRGEVKTSREGDQLNPRESAGDGK